MHSSHYSPNISDMPRCTFCDNPMLRWISKLSTGFQSLFTRLSQQRRSTLLWYERRPNVVSSLTVLLALSKSARILYQASLLSRSSNQDSITFRCCSLEQWRHLGRKYLSGLSFCLGPLALQCLACVCEREVFTPCRKISLRYHFDISQMISVLLVV